MSPKDDLPDLTRDEMLRYSRHLILPEIGSEGQRRLKAARVAMVGMGGLGSPAALYLAAAGVGTLGLVDDDVVEKSNLQRQVIHGTGDLGRRKVESARDRIRDVNPGVKAELHPVRLTSANAMEILGGYDLVVDGTDNFPTRYLVNDASVLLGRPFVYGSIFRFDGQAALFAAPGGPCYRCLFREPPPPHLVPHCAEGGVLGVLPGIIGSVQALEAIKWILGIGDTGTGSLLIFDGLELTWRKMAMRRDPGCVACGDDPSIDRLIDYDYEEFCGLGEDAEGPPVPEVTPRELKARLNSGESVRLIDVRDPNEWSLVNLEHCGARLVPRDRLSEATAELLGTDGPIILYCRTGERSVLAARELMEAGVTGVEWLSGGILAWQEQVDPSLLRY